MGAPLHDQHSRKKLIFSSWVISFVTLEAFAIIALLKGSTKIEALSTNWLLGLTVVSVVLSTLISKALGTLYDLYIVEPLKKSQPSPEPTQDPVPALKTATSNTSNNRMANKIKKLQQDLLAARNEIKVVKQDNIKLWSLLEDIKKNGLTKHTHLTLLDQMLDANEQREILDRLVHYDLHVSRKKSQIFNSHKGSQCLYLIYETSIASKRKIARFYYQIEINIINKPGFPICIEAMFPHPETGEFLKYYLYLYINEAINLFAIQFKSEHEPGDSLAMNIGDTIDKDIFSGVITHFNWGPNGHYLQEKTALILSFKPLLSIKGSGVIKEPKDLSIIAKIMKFIRRGK